MRVVVSVVAASVAMALAGCGSSENSKIEKVINADLAKAASCTDVPIGQKVDYTKVGADGALGILKAKGYITESQGSSKDFFGRVSTFDTYALAETGKPLVQRQGNMFSGPCVRTGHFEIAKIEAVDLGNDAGGQPVANVRARIKFVPEDWIASTKTIPAWSSYWKDISGTENAQWLYPLLKSGSDFYSHGLGHRLQ